MTYVDSTNRDEYTATSGQTVFAYTFRILTEGEIKVYDDGTLQTLTTHYTVSGVGTAGGGNITFVTGVTLNNTVILLRDTPDTQSTDYTVSGIFPAESHEQALDKLTMKAQDLEEKIGRAVTFAVTSLLSDIVAPEGTSAADGGGKVWAWNSARTALELLSPTVIDSVSLIAVKGDIIQGDASGDAAKLAIGADETIPFVSTDLLAYDKPWSICWKKGADLASTAALTLGDDGNYFDVTGTDAITSIVANDLGKVFRLHFDGALVLTHHATNLILPGSVNITTAAGHEATFVAYASGDVRLVSYMGTSPVPLDEDDMASDSATRIATQQSIKAYVDSNSITLGTEQASTSGTAIDFTSIPAGTKKITIMLVGVSTDGTEELLVQLGDSGGAETSGYSSAVFNNTSSVTSTAGFIIVHTGVANNVFDGSVILTLENSANFTWTCISAMGSTSAANTSQSQGGTKSLSAELDRVRITTTGTPDDFDAGVINIQFE